jgi:hypothetical protein
MSITIPISLTKDQVLSFQKLYFEAYNEKINFQEAEEKGLQLTQFIATVLQVETEIASRGL